MICVYDIGNTGYEGNGNAVLQPTACSHRNVAGGGYDLTMTHPIDREGKWKHLVPGAVIKCPVPREEIENAFAGYEADVYKANTDTALREGMSEPTAISYTQWNPNADYQIGDKVSVPGWTHKNYKCVYFDMTSATTQVPPYNCSWWEPIADYTTGAAVLVTLPAGTEVYFMEDVDGTWYKMSTYYGIIGYVKKSQLTFYRHLSQTETLPRIITEQMFRIEKPTVDTKAGTVTVNANHVSYDLSGVLIQDVNLAQASPAMALGRLAEGFMIDYAGTIATNLTAADNGTYTQNIKGKNGMYALLDPDRGIVSTFGAAFKRDNWDLFVMARTNQDRGYRIRYRKNMLGVNWAQDSSGLVTRVVPVAKDAGGADLYLPEKWVDSSRINQYPVIKMEYLTVKGQVGKDDGTGTDTVWTEEALLDEMRTKAAERFSVDKADQVGVTVTVDFEQLGAAEEHPELKGLESVLLYDTVTVIHEDIGLSLQLYVSEIEYDAVRRKVTAVKLVNAMDYNKGSVTGYNVQPKSIGSEKLMDDVAGEILEQVTGIVPQYSDQTGESGSRMNTKDNNGFVAKGSGNANKVWKTDGQGNPGWRDEQTVTGFIPTSEKGAANGVATLDSGGKVPASELPSYVDDVLEYASKSNFPTTGEAGKIYVAKDTGKTYRWSGSAYVELSSYDEATQSASGLMSAADKQKLDGIETGANKYTLPLAANGTRGGVQTGFTKSGNDYPVALSNEKMYVNISDKLPMYLVTSCDANTVSGDGMWIVKGTTTNAPVAKHGSLINVATVGTPCQMFLPDNELYIYKRYYTNSAWTAWTKMYAGYADSAGSAGSAGSVAWDNVTGKPSSYYTLPLAANGTRGGVQIGYTETGKKYAVKLDSEKMYVEVPWTADGGNAATVNGKTVGVNVPADAVFTDHQYSAGTGLSLSSGEFSVKLGYTTANKKYKVQADTNGNLYVDVPWTDTPYSLPLAADGTRGGVQVGFTTDATNRNYAVQLSSEKMYVNVPWTDTKNVLERVATGLDSADTAYSSYAESGKLKFVVTATGATNNPTSNGNWQIIETGDANYGFQLAMQTDSNNVYFRRKFNGTWNGWANLTQDTVYTLPLAASGTRGGVQIGYTTDGANRNYAVQLSSEKMYVNVPWENTWRGIQNNLTSDSTTDSLSAAQGKALATGSARDNTKAPLDGTGASGTWGISITGNATTATTAQYLSTPQAAGYTSDAYGNFKHASNNTTNYWALANYAGAYKFKYYWETGDITTDGGITAAIFTGQLIGTADKAVAPYMETLTIAAGSSGTWTFPANSVHYLVHASNAGCFKVDVYAKQNDLWWTVDSQNQNFGFSNSGRTMTITNGSAYSVTVRIGTYYSS